jgi:hypothetical protein
MPQEQADFDRRALSDALEILTHSAGTRTGQMCHFDPYTWNVLRGFLSASLSGRECVISEGE